MNMDQLGQDSGRAAEYITLLKGVSPLAWTSFVIALAVGLYGMRLRNLLRSWVQLVVTVINMLLYSAITSVMGGQRGHAAAVCHFRPLARTGTRRADHGQSVRDSGVRHSGTESLRAFGGQVS